MSRLRYSIVLLALGAAFGVGVPCASAIDPFPNSGVVTLHSEHFMIHYSRDDHNPTCQRAFMTQEEAGDILGRAERAYRFYTGWGFAAPDFETDGNGYYDISVDDLTATGSTCVMYDGPIDPSVPIDPDGTYGRWDALINPDTLTSGYIHLDAKKGVNFHVIAHEVFHLFELKADPTTDQWFQEGAAEWAAFRAERFLTPTDPDLGNNPDRTADCVGAECGDTELDKNGYPGWLFFEYLSERYDPASSFASPDKEPTTAPPSFVSVWGKAGTGVDKLAAFLGTTTVESFYNDFATTRLSGDFTLAAINGKLPPAQASITTGGTSATLPTTYVAVNHLAARFVTLRHDDPANLRAPCYSATLALTITIPKNVTSTPYYYANTYGSVPQAFTTSVDPSSGDTIAKLTLYDWNTCAASPDAWLSLPNDSWNPPHDGQEFRIDATLTVYPSIPASPAGPSGTTSWGPVVDTPFFTPPPTLKLYAPEVLRVKAANPVLRFVVFSSGDGQLRAELGSSDLGTSDLRAGNNDVRFRLPKSLVAALRKTSARNILSLTSLAPNGDSGDTLTRTVVIQPTPKKKKKTVKHR